MDNIKQSKLDKAIITVFPSWGAKRLKSRAFIAAVESYTGASRTRGALKSWNPSKGDANNAILRDLPTLRDRSRDLVRNSALAGGAINTPVTNVISTGLNLQSRIDGKFLGLSDDKTKEVERTIEREFNIWAKYCDITRQLNFHGKQELAFRQSLEIGEAFELLPRKKDPRTYYDLKLQSVEGDRVSNKDNAYDTKEIAGGIEKDSFGAPRNYFISAQFPGNTINRIKNTWKTIPAFGTKTGLPNIIHLYKMLRPEQNRGVPFLAPVIEKIKQIDRYIDAELMASVIQGMYTILMETPSGEEDLPGTGTNPTIGDQTNNSTGEKELAMDYGAIIDMRPGEKPHFANPMRPNVQFDFFISALTRQIGSQLEIPQEVLLKHFTASYSASRAALLEAWRFFRVRRKWLSDYYCQPIFEVWLYEAVAKGRVSAPGFFNDISIRQAYSGTQWIAPGPGQIDPLKEGKAQRERLSLLLTTHSDEAAEYGKEFDKIIPQRAKEGKMISDANLSHEINDESQMTIEDMNNEDN